MICKICYDEFNEENALFPLQGCACFFHGECLQAYLRNEIGDSRFPLKCPGDECKAELRIDDIREILDKEEVEKYYQFTLN
mmetsp:Transcript_46317/g.34027  ORF Transcript_46317/g.34027 Transcript_46317/m.34027 type:complete len:81 (+) Transcript_46317:453-695(+)